MTIAIILTAAVYPSVQGPVTVRDPQVRLAQYAVALGNWSRAVTARGWQMAVVETTGSAAELRSRGMVARTTWLGQYEPDAAALARGKGAVEADAIDWLLDENADRIHPTTSVFKCTGRLWLKNHDRVLTEVGRNSVRVRSTMDGSWVDSRLLGATAQTWRSHLRQMGAAVDDPAGVYLEQVIGRRLHIMLGLDAGTIERFPRRPQLVGISGTTGKAYRGRGEIIRTAVLDPIEELISRNMRRKQL
jgi:hypothetical protein